MLIFPKLETILCFRAVLKNRSYEKNELPPALRRGPQNQIGASKMQHFLKTNPLHFHDLKIGVQNGTIRKNDRNFKAGDEIIFMSYDAETEECNGDSFLRQITNVQYGWGVQEGFCFISVSKLIK